jgi:hypothetical protein
MALMAQSHNKFIFNKNVEDYTFVLLIKVSDENDKLHNMKMHFYETITRFNCLPKKERKEN